MREETKTRGISGGAEFSPAAASGPAAFRATRPVGDTDVADLACSLDGLYGCIELINEGRPAPVTRIMRDLEKSIITQAMTMSQANIRGAAALLGIKYTTLYAKIRKHGLRFSKAVRFAPASAEADARFLGR